MRLRIFVLLAGQALGHRMATLIHEWGMGFEPQQDYLDVVSLGGGDDDLITALRSAKVM